MAASTALSVVIVAAVAIFLREPDVARRQSRLSRSEPRSKALADQSALVEARVVKPSLPRGVIGLSPSRPTVVDPGPSHAVAASTLAQVEGPEQRPVRDKSVDRVAVVSRRRSIRPTQARGAFTTVEQGESLADVAERVYGDESAKERLWAVNRDELPRRDSPLKAGTLLRTP
ncbi:hypothetical protein EP7_001116 [Isosphaeraceae bacterium EP7]